MFSFIKLNPVFFFFQLPDHILGQMDEDDNDVPRNVADIDDCSVDPSMKDTYFTELKVFSRQRFSETQYELCFEQRLI